MSRTARGSPPSKPGRGPAPRRIRQTPWRALRGPVDHVVILDGTMSSLEPGWETNAGLTWKLLSELAPRAGLSVRYEPGLQWENWRQVRNVVIGRGLNSQIQRAYGALASRYRQGDRIFLFGYSRGAYAVRSLAGVIDRVGLVRADDATARTVAAAYRLYRDLSSPEHIASFRAAHCHEAVRIEMIGAWDTVKALGLRAPLVWRWSQVLHAFHNHDLGPTTLRGYHALAMGETRRAYEPVLWNTTNGFEGICEQMWFRGTHGDVGGQQGGRAECRPLANIPLVWMLDKAESCGLPLPDGWRARFPMDPEAPSSGSFTGWSKLFLNRARRPVGLDPSEAVHPTALPAPATPATFRTG
ncbi:DUF2235 domain-containing protein [Oceaniglobus roseus]|uniref:DUF2235 domain-containing protein n=1 Tax=Oceaniglobus roseus TaxID=1737570 RepID=UPI000C7EB40A|nr:DUF2235 domain-containing protein [Kandeliimicrobium roseum]